MIIKLLDGVTVEIESNGNNLIMEADKIYDKATVITCSEEENWIKNQKNDIRIFSWPGEYELGDFLFYAEEANNEKVVFVVRVEDMHIAHLGKAQNFSPEMLDKVDNIDVLILPVNDTYLTPEEAKKVAQEFEARIIIPVGDNSDEFIKIMGNMEKKEPQLKAKITRNSLPHDKTEIIKLLKN